MTSSGRTPTRDEIKARIDAYFHALDTGDAQRAASYFTADATLTCESDGTHLRGTNAIKTFFQQICDESTGMTHSLLNTVIDVDSRSAATELTYQDTLKDGRRYDMRNCNFFDFDETGIFTRVHFWLGAALE
jgi:uncharacterized protein (TIGR02246 family)